MNKKIITIIITVICIIIAIIAIPVVLLFIVIFLTTRDPEIIRAARNGNIEKVNKLLVAGVDINETNSSSATPLKVAVKNNHIEMVEFLIAKGADVNKYHYELGTALRIATKDRNKEMIKLLLKNGAEDGRESWRWAINNNDLELVKFFIEEVKIGIETQRRDGLGYTPLMLAVQARDIEIVKYLISQGADVNATDDSGPCVHGHYTRHPLDILYHPGNTIDKKEKAIIKLLQQHGAKRGNISEKIKQKSESKTTPKGDVSLSPES